MKRMMTLLLAAVMLLSLLTVGASASETYTETVDGITYTLDNVIDKKELVVQFDDYDFGKSRSNPYEETVTVCQIVANKSKMTVTNNSTNAIYPGEVTYGIFGEGYIVDNGGQMCDEVAPGDSGSWYRDAICWADTTELLQIPGEDFLPTAESPRARIVTYLYRNAQ